MTHYWNRWDWLATQLAGIGFLLLIIGGVVGTAAAGIDWLTGYEPGLLVTWIIGVGILGGLAVMVAALGIGSIERRVRWNRKAAEYREKWDREAPWKRTRWLERLDSRLPPPPTVPRIDDGDVTDTTGWDPEDGAGYIPSEERNADPRTEPDLDDHERNR